MNSTERLLSEKIKNKTNKKRINKRGLLTVTALSVFLMAGIYYETSDANAQSPYHNYIRYEEKTELHNKEQQNRYKNEHVIPIYEMTADELLSADNGQSKKIDADENIIEKDNSGNPIYRSQYQSYVTYTEGVRQTVMEDPVLEDDILDGEMPKADWKKFYAAANAYLGIDYNSEQLEKYYKRFIEDSFTENSLISVKPSLKVTFNEYYMNEKSKSILDEKETDNWKKSMEEYSLAKDTVDTYRKKVNEYNEKYLSYEGYQNYLQMMGNSENTMSYRKYLELKDYLLIPEQPQKPENYTAYLEKMKNRPDEVRKHVQRTISIEKREISLEAYSTWFSLLLKSEDGKDHILSDSQRKKMDELSRTDFKAKEEAWTKEQEIIKKGESVANTAYSQLGDRYYWGAEGPVYFDCSGLVYYALTENGCKVDRETADYYGRHGTEIKLRDIRKGDVIAIGKSENRYTHIGIYIGNGKVVHAGGGNSRTLGNNPNAKVKIARLSEFINGSRKNYSIRRYYDDI